MASGALSRGGAAVPLSRAQDLILPIGLIACVLVILVPVPPALMDVLLSANVTIAVVMLLTTVYVRTPLEFSVFPSLLLATTLVRLVLNVSTTRLILTHGGTAGLSAAGGVVQGFGEFVAGDNIVVGLVIFVILVIIQFVVITKGATRISEVAARFALDGMPGRQMAIDADLNAGTIDEKEAQRRRMDITRQADFFGAMDGASKFVRGDAIAGILIIVINIVGGLAIGIFDAGMPLTQAVAVFTKLTIGDGLVTQVPAFLISLAAGLLVTRSSYEVNLPSEFIKQMFSRPQALAVAGGFLGVLIFTGLPRIPLLLIGSGCIGLSVMLSRRDAQAKADEDAKKKTSPRPAAARVEDYLLVEPMELEIGIGLIRLADPNRGGDLLDRIHRIRQSVAAEIGIILPKVRIRDNTQLGPQEYRIKISDAPVAIGSVQPGQLLAIDTGRTTGAVPGTPTREPAYGTPALWIQASLRDEAQTRGYRLVDPAAVIATHLTEVIRKHADELLTRDATKHLIDELKKNSPAAVDELIPGVMKLAEVQQILQTLLREQVPIRQLGAVLETLGDYAPRTKDPILLTEFVRARLARTLSTRYCDDAGCLHVVTLDPAVEDRIRAGFEHTERGMFIRLSPIAVETICRKIAAGVGTLVRLGHPPVLLVSPSIRAAVRQMAAPHVPNLVVLSYNEIARDTKIESVATVAENGE